MRFELFCVFGNFFASGTQDAEVTKSLLFYSSPGPGRVEDFALFLLRRLWTERVVNKTDGWPIRVKSMRFQKYSDSVSEQDGRAFDLASKSLNFCLFSSCVWVCVFFFHFFRCFRYIMAVYVTREELDKILVLWCTLCAANCVHSRCFCFFVFFLCICFFITV